MANEERSLGISEIQEVTLVPIHDKEYFAS